jgi:hypothetical protein
MTGTAPMFFQVPVTTELYQRVQRGEYPAILTTVLAHIPDIPRPEARLNEGMKPLDDRRVMLECYEAFKKFSVPSFPSISACTLEHSMYDFTDLLVAFLAIRTYY